jgi:hypothetical protein
MYTSMFKINSEVVHVVCRYEDVGCQSYTVCQGGRV